MERSVLCWASVIALGLAACGNLGNEYRSVAQEADGKIVICHFTGSSSNPYVVSDPGELERREYAPPEPWGPSLHWG
jgi:hypothetical protein